jgi:Holliday junction resolvase RusA-like endonuclease
MKWSFFVDCVPPKVTSQQKGVSVRCSSSNGVLHSARPVVYTKSSVEAAKLLFAALFARHRPPRPLDGPLLLIVVMTYPWRKNERKSVVARGWNPIPVKPDFDNLLKVPVDALSRLSFWDDDGQVFDGRLIKGWGDKPGVRVTIEEVDPGGDFRHLIGAEE